MIFYQMTRPGVMAAHFKAVEIPSDNLASFLIDAVNKPVCGYLSEWDMGRLQGMLDAGARMNGNILVENDPDRLGMLKVSYSNHSLYGVFATKTHSPEFSVAITSGWDVQVIHQPTFGWVVGKGPTLLVKFGKDGQPIDIPCAYEEPRVKGPDNPTDVDTSPS